MKNIDVEINSFGKIKQAKFQLKPFTIIAGKNASGKSFITRALYCVFSSLNKDHLAIDFADSVFRLQSLMDGVQVFSESPSEKIKSQIGLLADTIDNLSNNIELTFHQNSLSSQINNIAILKTDLLKLSTVHEQLLNEMKKRNNKYGMVTMCVGTGQGAAGIFEMIN